MSPTKGSTLTGVIWGVRKPPAAVRNRKFGPAIVMELAERAPRGFDNIEDVITRRELEDAALSYKIDAGFEGGGPGDRADLRRRVRRGVVPSRIDPAALNRRRRGRASLRALRQPGSRGGGAIHFSGRTYLAINQDCRAERVPRHRRPASTSPAQPERSQRAISSDNPKRSGSIRAAAGATPQRCASCAEAISTV